MRVQVTHHPYVLGAGPHFELSEGVETAVQLRVLILKPTVPAKKDEIKLNIMLNSYKQGGRKGGGGLGP